MIKKIPFLLLVFSLEFLGSESLFFMQEEGDLFHGDSKVTEDVYINGYYSHSAEIDEFSVSSVLSVDEEGKARLESQFRTVERIGGYPGYYEWLSSETVQIERTSEGEMFLSESAARPVLRQVPRFPDYEVEPGDTWSFPAQEVHILRINGYLFGPYSSTTQVQYEYKENIISEGREVALINLGYNLYLPIRRSGEPVRLITGQSKQQILWNIVEGKPEEKWEDFEFLMFMSDGMTQEFIGQGITTYRKSRELDRPFVAEQLSSQLEDVPGLTVEPNEEGVLLSFREEERIFFEPDSALIRREERYRLERLAESLKAYADRDILITGHTAHYGTIIGREQLSRDRAAAVADLLFPEGRPGPGRLFLRGAGSHEPTGNDKDNRRVEILILD